MKRMDFLQILAVVILAPLSSLCKRDRFVTWPEYIAGMERLGKRRWEHYLHPRHCRGGSDYLRSAADVEARKRRCAAICGLCRYLNSPITPIGSAYRRPPQSYLNGLERDPLVTQS